MQVTLKQSDMQILTHNHYRRLWLFVSVLRFCECFRNELKAFGFAVQSPNRLVHKPRSPPANSAAHYSVNYTQIPLALPSLPLFGVVQIFSAWPKWKPQLCFLFLFYFPVPFPNPEKLSTFCSRLAARLAPLSLSCFSALQPYIPCLSVCLAWCIPRPLQTLW